MYNTKALLTAEFKKLGYNSRKISIRKGGGACETSYHVKIKDLDIDIDEIRDICKKYERIRYDEYCGEILAGGNTFIFVEYDSSLPRKAVKCRLLNNTFKHKGYDCSAEFVNDKIVVTIPNQSFENYVRYECFIPKEDLIIKYAA